MKIISTMNALVVVSGFALVGCIDSPLLNHADASDPVNPIAQNEKCPLEFPKADLCASLEWVKTPSEEEAASFTLRFWSLSQGTEAGPYVTPTNDVFVKLWMPSMGHGSSPVTLKPATGQAGEIVPGVFDVTNVHFIMSGDWEIQVQLRQDRKMIEQAKLDVRI